MKINEVEALVGITRKNIRFYEAEGLLSPRRNSQNGYRDYGETEVEVLRRIKLLRKLGLPLEEIRQMQHGAYTVGDGMRRHLVSLERERQNLEAAIRFCGTLTDRRERLEELDRQIEKKRSTKQDTTANSAKAVAESERKLWENELNQLLNGLRRHMSSDTWDAFMKDQNEWIRSREAMAVDALSGNSGSAMQELEYTRSLAEITRDRAYELAEEYYDLLSETE